MSQLIIKTHLSIWLSFAVWIFDALMIHPSFASFIVAALIGGLLIFLRYICHTEAKTTTKSRNGSLITCGIILGLSAIMMFFGHDSLVFLGIMTVLLVIIRYCEHVEGTVLNS